MRRALIVMIGAVLVLLLQAPASAGIATEIVGHEPHIGTTSECAARWHFVVNQLEEGHSAGTLTAEFENAGVVAVDANKVLASVQHFDVILDGPDTLLAFSATISGEHPDAKLLLSHVECVTPPSTTTTTTTTLPSTTTTTVPQTTTTTLPPETTTTTTTTTMPSSTTTTTTTVPPSDDCPEGLVVNDAGECELPDTGLPGGTLPIAGVGLLLLSSGAFLLWKFRAA